MKESSVCKRCGLVKSVHPCMVCGVRLCTGCINVFKVNGKLELVCTNCYPETVLSNEVENPDPKRLDFRNMSPDFMNAMRAVSQELKDSKGEGGGGG